MKECKNCWIEFEGRKDAKFCSDNCRVTFSRKASVVTDNVTFSEIPVTDKFKFTVARGKGDDKPNPVREAIHWYDVPIAAVPVLQKGWPEMPDYMNGRQYFLWFKNNFKINAKKGWAGYGHPVIHNPFPQSDKPVVYVQAGENSRHWGTN